MKRYNILYDKRYQGTIEAADGKFVEYVGVSHLELENEALKLALESANERVDKLEKNYMA